MVSMGMEDVSATALITVMVELRNRKKGDAEFVGVDCVHFSEAESVQRVCRCDSQRRHLIR
jgi:hypothetical protein